MIKVLVVVFSALIGVIFAYFARCLDAEVEAVFNRLIGILLGFLVVLVARGNFLAKALDPEWRERNNYWIQLVGFFILVGNLLLLVERFF